MTLFRFTYRDYDRRSAAGWNRILWSGILLLFLLFPFLTHHGDTGQVCQFHALTGLSCPTCGMSRSLYEFVHLHLLASFRMHLMGPFLYLTALVLFVKTVAEVVSGKKIDPGLRPVVIRHILLYTLLAWIVYWLVRMAVEYFSR